MGFLTNLFGDSGIWTAVFALGAVIVGIIAVLWLLKLLSNASGRVARGRNRRLAVVDTLALDPKRQLLIIRRDNVEHLILTGGPQDVVVETGIAVEEAPATQPARRPIPAVAPRKPEPAQKQAAAPAAPVVSVAPPLPAPAIPGSALARLREQGLPTDKRAHLSLRHTGLLRPVNETESVLSPENSVTAARAPLDSAKEDSAQREIEGIDRIEGNTEANRN